MFLPVGQNLDYDYPLYLSFTEPAVLLSLFVLIGLISVAMILRSRASAADDIYLRLASFGIFWFFITMSVESSIIPIKDVFFEHRLYLPSFGVVLTVTSLSFSVMRESSIVAKRLACLCGGIALLLLSSATVLRNEVWRDSIHFWNDVVAKSPAKIRGHHNLAVILLEKGRFREAISEYETTLALDPEDGGSHKDIANCLLTLGRVDESELHFLAALKKSPNDTTIHDSLGKIYLQKRDYRKAEEHLMISLRLQSGDENDMNDLIQYFKQFK
jgi:tetratricopeptide (TPR) repeat protein